MREQKIIFLSILLFICSCNTTFAAAGGDLSINESNVTFSSEKFLEGSTYRIYATVNNISSSDLRGNVQFYDVSAERQIGSDQTVTVFGNRTDGVFVDWTPYFEGTHVISVTVDPWNPTNDDPNNNTVKKTLTVIKDTDHDKIADTDDPDDDNDGVLDENDAFPEDAKEWVDTDGDTKGDTQDTDDDNDGILDIDDKFPLNPLESKDTDSDGTGDYSDLDDDNDGLNDTDEQNLGTDPLNSDTDQDGVQDGGDAFPLDKNEQYDFDKDGIGDNTDTDDDNDGVLDDADPNDHNKAPVIKISGNESYGFLNREILLDTDKSYDDDGSVKSVKWLIDGDNERTGNSLKYTFTSLGVHTVKTTIFDDKDEPTEKTLEIQIYDLDFYLTVGLFVTIFILAIMILFEYISKAFRKKQAIIN